MTGLLLREAISKEFVLVAEMVCCPVSPDLEPHCRLSCDLEDSGMSRDWSRISVTSVTFTVESALAGLSMHRRKVETVSWGCACQACQARTDAYL